MGRKNKKCRNWQQKMKARSKYKSPYRGMSTGRLAAYADWEGGETDANKKEACPCEGQAT